MSGSHEDVLARFVDAYNAGDWERLDGLVTPDYVHRNGESTFDLAGFKLGAAWIRSGLPDFRIEVLDTIRDGDRVALRFAGRGTHDGSFADEPPTGKDVVMHGIMIYRFCDGLIAEDWEAMDEQQLFKQIAPA